MNLLLIRISPTPNQLLRQLRPQFPNPSAIKADEWPEAHRIMRQLFETGDVLRLYAEVCGRWERS